MCLLDAVVTMIYSRCFLFELIYSVC
jgi:hypothetical protein